ncbi:MAG: SLC13 family permease, partial [Candidatus Woesearchaeota archaeon]
KHLAKLARYSLLLVLLLILLKILLVSIGSPYEFRLTYIALIGALPVLFASRKRWHLIKSIDWHTLVFFAAMFVLMQAVWDTGFFQQIIDPSWAHSLPAIFFVSILLSQLISNVPLVALYLPMLLHSNAPTTIYIALAAASTIAGNLFLLGAASTIIIIQNAEKKAKETITFWEFARIGIPLTLLNSLIYLGYFLLVF